MLAQLLQSNPDGPALCAGPVTVHRRSLARRLATEGTWLSRSGARRVGLLADNGIPWAIADLALGHAGLICVPLPHFFSPAQLRHAADDAALDAVLTDQPDWLRDLLPEFEPAATAPASGLSLLRRPPPAPVALPPGTSKITYTSGSTGTPKGVCLSAATLGRVAASVAGVRARLGPNRHLCLLPLATLLENVAGLYGALSAGVPCELPGMATTGMAADRPEPVAMLRAIDASQPGSLILVPELLRLLIAAAEAGWQPPGSLRFVAVGGAPVSPALLDRAAALGLPVYEGYGLSECGSVVCLNTPEARRPGSVGRPLPHAGVRLDADGQILVRGSLMAGYLRGEAVPGGEWPTGDVGEMDEDGYVHVRGRQRNVLITSLGRNVSPEWVERELLAERAIGGALALGDNQPYLAALLVPAAGADAAGMASAVARANRRLPGYAQIRRFAVMPAAFSSGRGELSPNGRLRRERILARHAPLVATLFPSPASRAGEPLLNT